jgi:hypothetical protein
MSGNEIRENEDLRPGTGRLDPMIDNSPAPPDGAGENKPLRLGLTGYRLFDDPHD